jgi:hypothetical protein
MTTVVIQKGDLATTDFSNTGTNNAGGVKIKTDATSSVGIAIAAALSGGSVPVATTAVQGIAAIATPLIALTGSDNSTIVTPFTLASTLSDLGLTSRTRRYFYANQ